MSVLKLKCSSDIFQFYENVFIIYVVLPFVLKLNIDVKILSKILFI